ncbi:MAG: SDR family oxidoreductase [Leeuwenhoekiella sp.]
MSKIILITGASSGIGKAIAEFLVTKGFTVYGSSRNPKQSVVNGVHFIKLDVTKKDSVAQAVAEVIQKAGRVDVLINNAGKGITGPLEEIPEEELKAVFETNYFGPLRMINSILPAMRKQNGGLIINVTSIAGYMGLPFRGAYSATKGALGLTTEAYRMELKNFNIKMTNMAPGDFATNIAAGRYHAPVKPGSPYEAVYQKSLNLMDGHVDAGMDPQVMAEAVLAVINTKNPKVHYKVGAFMQRISVVLKSILPDRAYEKVLLSHYKL